MNQKTLKKSLAVLLVGIMLLSQSAYADSMAAENPVAKEPVTVKVTAPDAESGMIDTMPVDDVEEEELENAPIVDADIISSAVEEAPVPYEDAAPEQSYADIKAEKEWKKWAEGDTPELVGAEESDAPWNGGDVTDLSLDETYEVSVEDGASVWFRFIPEETGNYKFYSFDKESGDPCAYLYDSEGDYLKDDDDGATGDDLNFAIRGPLTEGETYYFEATSYNDSETVYSVSIIQVPTVIDFTPKPVEGAHLVKESDRCGDWYDDGEELCFEYYDTSIQELFTIEYELSDGTTGEWVYRPKSGFHHVADSEVFIEFDSASAVTGTNTATMIIDGIEKSIQFEIIELPDIETITIEKNPDAKSLLVGSESYGYWDDEGTEDECFRFYWNFLMTQFVIHADYADGTTVDWQYNSEEENDYLDEKYSISIDSYDTYEDTVVLDIRVGEFEESIELELITFEEASSGAITETSQFSFDGDGYIVYTFTAPSTGNYDAVTSSKYGVSLSIYDATGHRVDPENVFYQQDGNNYTLKLTGGLNYYFLVESYSGYSQVNGTLSVQKHISVIDFAAVNDGFVPTVGSEVQGYYDEDDPTTFVFYQDFIARAFTIHLAYDDGTTDVWRYDDAKSMYVRNNFIQFSQVTDPPFETEKGVVEIKIGNITQTTEFTVNRTISKVKSLTVRQKRPLYAGFGAYWTTRGQSSEYLVPYTNQLFSCLEITAKFEDGTEFTQEYNDDIIATHLFSTSRAYYNDLYYASCERVDYTSWTIGSENVLKITVGDKTVSTQISIEDMLAGARADTVPSTEVKANRTPFTAKQENNYEHAFIVKAPATGEYSFSIEPEAADHKTYWGLYTTDGHMLEDNQDNDGELIKDPIAVSLNKDTAYIILGYYLTQISDAHEAALCVTLPANAAWPTPTPTPKPTNTPTPTPGTKLFSDVKDPKHAYYNAIYWAADEGITKGYPDGTFGINKSCTRGEMIMFLWRYVNKPAPKTVSKSPFKDVPKTHTFYKAILWAYQNGITKGYDDGTFGVNRNVSRGECMMFLWRVVSKPAPKAVSKSPFKDVAKTNAFYKAILWGYQNKITTGYTSGAKKGTFGINENCTRGQIVTFLYRLNNLK